jgi:hypothetical protein
MGGEAVSKDGDIFKQHSNKLVFEFDSQKAASYFKYWLCGRGEQEYWDWMERSEEELDGDITGIGFDYHTGTDTIKVKCGRMDNDWKPSE